MEQGRQNSKADIEKLVGQLTALRGSPEAIQHLSTAELEALDGHLFDLPISVGFLLEKIIAPLRLKDATAYNAALQALGGVVSDAVLIGAMLLITDTTIEQFREPITNETKAALAANARAKRAGSFEERRTMEIVSDVTSKFKKQTAKTVARTHMGEINRRLGADGIRPLSVSSITRRISKLRAISQ
jgi:hypothetical protein